MKSATVVSLCISSATGLQACNLPEQLAPQLLVSARLATPTVKPTRVNERSDSQAAGSASFVMPCTSSKSWCTVVTPSHNNRVECS